MVCSNGVVWHDLTALGGIFLLAAGASALNQYQERELDEKMDRTRRRPIPQGIISPLTALFLSILLIVAGLTLFLGLHLRTCLYLGLFNILWYNGLYTWLKKITPFAVIPGALTGVIPVLMGWSAAGGSVFAPEALMLAILLFLWQVPHFWLLMVKYADEYRKANLPVVSDVFSERQIRTVTFSWLAASSVASIGLLWFRMILSIQGEIVVILLSVAMVILAAAQLFIVKERHYRLLYLGVNLYLFLVLALLILENIKVL